MNRIVVLITLSDSGIETIKSNTDLPKKEMECVYQWNQDGVLESFFISTPMQEAVLIFKNIDKVKAMELIESLPYFPYMVKIEYHNLNKQF